MLRAVVEVVLPATCAGCGAPGAVVCDRCAGALRAAAPGGVPAGLDGLGAVFAYEGVAREVIARVKYRNARAAVQWLADAMAATVVVGAADVVTWAPTTPERRRERGFDHAELLARSVGRRLGLRPVALLAREPGPPQTGAGRAARGERPRFRAHARRTDGTRVLLVDDVVTTGATLTAAAAALRRRGARRVVAVVAGRTP